MTEIPSLQERIAKRKIIVYKSRVDATVVKLTAEKMKEKIFVKFGFSKPRPGEVRVISVDKYFEPYVLLEAKYWIKYFKKRIYSLEVDDQAEEVKILDGTFKPETVTISPEEQRKVVKLEAEEQRFYSNTGYMLLDKAGNELSLEDVPSAPSEDQPNKILKEFRGKLGKIEITPIEEVEKVKAKLVKRPPNADRIVEEVFEVSEYAIIYSPTFHITFGNERTGEERFVKLDGVTARIIT